MVPTIRATPLRSPTRLWRLTASSLVGSPPSMVAGFPSIWSVDPVRLDLLPRTPSLLILPSCPGKERKHFTLIHYSRDFEFSHKKNILKEIFITYICGQQDKAS